MKRTSQPKKRRRQRVHGFLERAARAKRGVGSHILQKRRAKGRKSLAPRPIRARGRKAVAA